MPNRVAQIAKKYGWNQAELGRRLGVTRMQAGRLIKGERPLTREAAERLAKIEDCHPAELLWPVVILRSDDESALVNVYRKLSEDGKGDLMDVAQKFLDRKSAKSSTEARKDAAD